MTNINSFCLHLLHWRDTAKWQKYSFGVQCLSKKTKKLQINLRLSSAVSSLSAFLITRIPSTAIQSVFHTPLLCYARFFLYFISCHCTVVLIRRKTAYVSLLAIFRLDEPPQGPPSYGICLCVYLFHRLKPLITFAYKMRTSLANCVDRRANSITSRREKEF